MERDAAETERNHGPQDKARLTMHAFRVTLVVQRNKLFQIKRTHVDNNKLNTILLNMILPSFLEE